MHRSLACVRRGAWGESLWNAQPVHCSPSAFGLLLHRNRSLALLSAAGLPSAAAANPSQRLWPTPAAQPCLRQAGAWGESPGTCSPCSYGLPKATLGILHRLHRGCKPFPAPCPPPRLQTLPSAFGLLLHRSLACVRREPGERASGTCSPCTAAPAPLAYSCIATAALPSYGSRPALRSACKPSPAPLAYSCTAALPSSSSRQLAGLPLLFLWASKSDVRHFAPPSNPPPRLQTLPSAFGLLLHRSLACVRREPGERALERAARAPMGFQKRR